MTRLRVELAKLKPSLGSSTTIQFNKKYPTNNRERFTYIRLLGNFSFDKIGLVVVIVDRHFHDRSRSVKQNPSKTK